MHHCLNNLWCRIISYFQWYVICMNIANAQIWALGVRCWGFCSSSSSRHPCLPAGWRTPSPSPSGSPAAACCVRCFPSIWNKQVRIQGGVGGRGGSCNLSPKIWLFLAFMGALCHKCGVVTLCNDKYHTKKVACNAVGHRDTKWRHRDAGPRIGDEGTQQCVCERKNPISDVSSCFSPVWDRLAPSWQSGHKIFFAIAQSWFPTFPLCHSSNYKILGYMFGLEKYYFYKYLQK